MNRDTFSSFHPMINFLYFALVLAFTMFFMHPVSLLISLGSALLYAINLNGKQAVRFSLRLVLPMMLMAAIISECRLSEGRRMTLEVRESNTTAQNLYIKFGFSVAGKRPGYYSDNNETALIMWADITDLDVQKVLN